MHTHTPEKKIMVSKQVTQKNLKQNATWIRNLKTLKCSCASSSKGETCRYTVNKQTNLTNKTNKINTVTTHTPVKKSIWLVTQQET